MAAAVVIALLGTALFFSSRTGPSIGSGPSTPSVRLAVGVDIAIPVPVRPGDVPRTAPAGHATARRRSCRPSATPPTGGWANTLDVRGELDLSYAAGGQYTYPDGLTFHDGISIFRRPVAESTTSQTPQAGVGTTANDLAQWLVGHPDLDASAPTPVTIGGASGYRLTLSVPAGTSATSDHCTTDHGEPRCASLFLSADPAATYGFGLVGPEIAVVFLLDTPSGDTVMVVIDDVDGVDQPGLEAAAMPIVNSLSFSP